MSVAGKKRKIRNFRYDHFSRIEKERSIFEGLFEQSLAASRLQVIYRNYKPERAATSDDTNESRFPLNCSDFALKNYEFHVFYTKRQNIDYYY